MWGVRTARTVDSFAESKGEVRIKTTEMTRMIKIAVTQIGKNVLEFATAGVRTNFNRSAAAMRIYLANVSVYIIVLTGRRLFNACLCYIRKQKREFTSKISALMLVNHDYFTIPDDQAGVEDARSPSAQENVATVNSGPGVSK